MDKLDSLAGSNEFRQLAPKKAPDPRIQANRRKLPNQDTSILEKGVKVMGEILSIASFVGTPLGAVCAIAFLAAAYFYGRWVLTD